MKLCRAPRLFNMVQLRSSQRNILKNSGKVAEQSSTVVPPPQSIARRFIGSKPTVGGAGNGVVKASTTGKRARTAPDSEQKRSGSSTTSSHQRNGKIAKKEYNKEPSGKTTATNDDDGERPLLERSEITKGTTIEYPRLPFDLNQAIEHLKSVDIRFHTLLHDVELKPYIELEEGQVRELDLFQTLASSILGQQVSWLAARAIRYRFVRLFYPELPEKPDFEGNAKEGLPFPHPIDVCDKDETFLRSAGLSGAKARYVKDIARRFSDGRLDVRKIIQMDEEACVSELVKIKGVGRWTAEMLLLFALRRGNVLPVGDLGVQKGMLLFFLSDQKGPDINEKKRKRRKTHEGEPIPVIEEHLTESQREIEQVFENNGQHATGPSIKDEDEHRLATSVPPLPEGLSYSLLRSRKEGKKAKGNMYLL